MTNVPKLRSFQYRLLQRALITNMHLYKWNWVPSNLCTFCQDDQETITHLFYECSMVKNLWTQVIAYLKDTFDISGLHLTAAKVIFNTIVEQKHHVANFICLVTKQFIYRRRCQKEQLVFGILKTHIANIQLMEKYIAVKNKKESVYYKKWHPFEKNDSNSGNLNEYVQNYLEVGL